MRGLSYGAFFGALGSGLLWNISSNLDWIAPLVIAPVAGLALGILQSSILNFGLRFVPARARSDGIGSRRMTYALQEMSREAQEFKASLPPDKACDRHPEAPGPSTCFYCRQSYCQDCERRKSEFSEAGIAGPDQRRWPPFQASSKI